MNRQGQRIYRLDGIEIDTAQVCLKRDGQEQHVRQRRLSSPYLSA